MVLTLKDRKRIQNTLPKYSLGNDPTNEQYRPFGTLPFASELDQNYSNKTISFQAPSMADITKEAGNFNFAGKTEGVTSAADALKGDVIAKNNAATDALPSMAKKGGAGQFLKNNAGGIMNTAMSAINFANTISGISKNNYSSDEMMGSGGTSQESANGVGYTQQRVDDAGIQKQIDATAAAAVTSGLTSGASLGMAVGSVIPGLGTLAGGAIGGIIGGALGIFGGNKAKREAERQKRIAINRTNAANTQNREQAYTIGLRNEFNRENVTDESQSLFHAARGLENVDADVDPITMRTVHKHLADTADGIKPDYITGYVKKGETMVAGERDSNNMHNVHDVKRGPNDNAPASIKDGDDVFSDLWTDWKTGLPLSKAVSLNAKMHGGKISTKDKIEYEMNQNVERMMHDAGIRKDSIFPHYLGGTNKIWNTVKSIGQNLDLENIIPTITAYTTAAQRDAQAEGGLRAPKSFVANPYENAALDELNKLHSDYYTEWAGNREAEGRAKSAIAQSGGLSAGQKMLAYMGMLNQTQQNNANAMFDAQKLNNEYRGQAAKIKLATGENSATRQSEAYRWDEDMLAKAHAARLNLWETSQYDRQNALESFFHNRFKKNQFDRTMNLYESQQKNDEAKTKAIIDSLYNNDNKPSRPTTYTPMLLDIAKSITTPFGAASLGIAQLPRMPQTFDIAPKAKQPEAATTPIRKSTTVRTSRKPANKSYTVTNDAMGKQFASVVTKPQKKESKKATTQAKPTEDVTTKSTLLSSVQAGGRNLISLSSNKDISPYSVVKQEERKLKSKVGKSNASSFAENVSETVSKAYEDGQKKRKSQLKKQPAKQESKAGKSNASSFLDALSKLYAEGQKRREKTLKEQRGY